MMRAVVHGWGPEQCWQLAEEQPLDLRTVLRAPREGAPPVSSVPVLAKATAPERYRSVIDAISERSSVGR